MKTSIASRLILVFVSITTLLILFGAGCTVQDKGAPYENETPRAWITVAPNDSAVANHYLSLRWAGNDGDGTVAAFRLFVDNVQISYTAATDTTMAFASPTDSGSAPHTFGVIAVDDEGRESARAERFFYTVNYAPSLDFDADGSVADGSTVSPGFRITLAASDPNPSLFFYSVSLDGENWTPWVSDSQFLFGNPRLHSSESDSTVAEIDDDGDGSVDEEKENGVDDDNDGRVDEDTRGLYPDGSYVVSTVGRESGPLTIWARVKDAGDASSPIISRSVTLDATLRPAMDSTVTGVYGTSNLYPDGSQYFQRQTDIETSIAFSASFAEDGTGMVNSYRYQYLGDSLCLDSIGQPVPCWSDWIQTGVLHFVGLPAGDHGFRFIARDLAGNTTPDTMTFAIHLVEPHLRRKVVIVDESFNTNITPEDSVNAFYRSLFAAYETVEIDYLGRGSFLSPFDLSDAGLLVYHAEDRSDLHLTENTRIMRDYLSRGGRMVLSGWDLLRPLAPGAQDTVLGFAGGSFGHDFLKLNSAECTPFGQGSVPTPRFARGWVGATGYPNCPIDTLYIHNLPRTRGVEQTWVFRPQGQCRIIGNLVVRDPSDPIQAYYADRPVAYIYDQSFRIAVFGFPLYFVDRSSAHALMDDLAEELLQGLSNP
ncbi:hypothetical protein HZB60_07820 [candidate division KSB1 bacterium]|nr:hypothetical protein [candidate division KSB1 bacterium]